MLEDLVIEKDRDYEIIVFPNQDEGLKAQRTLVTNQIGFKHISTLAVVVPGENSQGICSMLFNEGALISGHYDFFYRNYEEDYFKKAQAYKPSKNDSEFLKSITLCYVAPCLADEKKIRLIGYLSTDISGLLPYLNATIKGASYNKNTPALTYTKEYRVINLYDLKIAIAKADDIIDAWHSLDEVKEKINKTYINKESIKPNYDEKVKVTALQLYGWLPKSNCKSCGEQTCLAFSVQLLNGKQKLENCLPLFNDSKFSENRNIVKELSSVLGI